METEKTPTRYTFALIDNGREIDNIDADSFDTEDEARAAGERELDNVCPKLSPTRKFYRVETRTV